MDGINKPGTTIDAFKAEIHRLLEKQGNALKVAAYIGLTPKEARECDACHIEIAKLVEQWLESPETVRTTSLQGRNMKDGIDEDVPWWGLLGDVLRP